MVDNIIYMVEKYMVDKPNVYLINIYIYISFTQE